MTIVHSKDGQAGVLLDHGTGKAIRFAVWYDAESGDYEAIHIASNGVDMACDEDYKLLRYQGKAVGKLELIPLNRASDLGVEPQKVIEPERLTVQQKEQGIEDYRKLYYGVWGKRGYAPKTVDSKWVDFVSKSSFLDSLIIRKGRLIPTT